MKVLAIIATNRRKGSIDKLCSRILDGAKSHGHEIETINLYDYQVKDCIGCWACVKNNRCIHQDDFEKLFHKVKQADAIILGAPCYWGNIPGILKTFFDRHTAYAMYKPPMAAKFQNMTTPNKLKTLKAESSNLGPLPELRGKKFILAVSLTLPFPMSHLSGDLITTLKALRIYIHKLKGKEMGKIIFTDTLFRLRKNKENLLMKKAFKLGSKL